MPSAQIIAIGTELLLGVIQDTNTAFITRTLNQYGVDIFKTVIIGDNEARIAREIRSSLESADIIITTGGLGPTVDDPTRQAVARAFNVDVEFHPELWGQIQDRYRSFNRVPTENNKRQAYLPQGAQAISNPVGTAPAFSYTQAGKIVVSLPGVPSEMKTLLMDYVIPILQEKYDLSGTTIWRTLHTAGIGESNVDVQVADFEAYSNPTVGLAAHSGQVDIRITAKADSREEALKLIQPVEDQIKERLGVKIYGTDEDTLIGILIQLVKQHDLHIDVFYEAKLEEIPEQLCGLDFFNSCQPLPVESDISKIKMDSLYNDNNEHDYLLVASTKVNNRKAMDMRFHLNGKDFQNYRSFGGHLALYPAWVKNHILSFIRETIIQEKGDLCKK
jgi:competence/damage-inducible protein CinA-like protein